MSDKIGTPPMFGAIQFTIGVLVLTQSYFIIQISQFKDLWWQVINSIGLTPWNLIISYIMIGFALWQISAGVLTMIKSDKNADIKKQKIIEYGMPYRNQTKSSRYYDLVTIFMILEFLFVGIILASYEKILPKILPYKVLALGVCVFVLLAVVFYCMALKHYAKEKATAS